MGIKQKTPSRVRKPNRTTKLRWSSIALLLVLLLGLFLSACAGPRYGDYGGHGGHHYLLENTSGGQMQ
jgi:hypothetical protein